MKYPEKKTIYPYYLAAAILGIIAAVRIPAVRLSYRFANGLFFGGILLLLWGLARLAHHMGSGDLFLYSGKRFRQLLRKKEEKTEEIKSYYEYLAKKPKSKPYGIFLLSGLFLVVLSVIISISF